MLILKERRGSVEGGGWKTKSREFQRTLDGLHLRAPHASRFITVPLISTKVQTRRQSARAFDGEHLAGRLCYEGRLSRRPPTCADTSDSSIQDCCVISEGVFTRFVPPFWSRFYKWWYRKLLHQTQARTSKILVDRIRLGRVFQRHVSPQHRVEV